MLVGFDRLLLPALEMGCGGVVSGVSSVFPEPLVEIYRAWQAGDKEAAKKVGALIAERALSKGISEVVFDRGGYLYHGRVSELAAGAREGGLKF